MKTPIYIGALALIGLTTLGPVALDAQVRHPHPARATAGAVPALRHRAAHHTRLVRDAREDIRDRREDRRDRREDVFDRLEDRIDRRHNGGPRDRIEDVFDRREDRRDRREDHRDRREDRRDRRHGV